MRHTQSQILSTCPLPVLLALAILLVPSAGWAGEELPAKSAVGISSWVPAAEAFHQGELRQELFTAAEQAEIESWFRRPGAEARETPPGVVSKSAGSGDCDVLIVESSHSEAGDPRKALHGASTALVGTVTTVEPGLFRGRLASIVAVRVDRWLEQPANLAAPETVYFLQEDARISVDGTTYCRRGPRSVRVEPGRKAFVATSNLLEDAPVLLLPYDHQLFFETAGGGVSAAGSEDDGAASGWSDFEQRVVRLAGEGG